MSKLVNDLYDLVSLAKQESESNRYDNSDEYKKLFNRLEDILSLIDDAEPSETLKYVNGKIANLEDALQHYTMVEKDKCREFYIREDLKQFINIKQALQRLEAIDNAKPSVALECLENLRNSCFYDEESGEYVEDTEEYEVIKQFLTKAQEKVN